MNTTSDPHDATNPESEDTSFTDSPETQPPTAELLPGHDESVPGDDPSDPTAPAPTTDTVDAATSDAQNASNATSPPPLGTPPDTATTDAGTVDAGVNPPPTPRAFPADLDTTTPLGSVLSEAGITQRELDPTRTPDPTAPADYGAIVRTLPPTEDATDSVGYRTPNVPTPSSSKGSTGPGRGVIFGLTLVASMLGALLMLGGMWAFGAFDDPASPGVPAVTAAPSAAPVATLAPGQTPVGGYDPVQVGNRVVPSVVAIEVGQEVDGEFSAVASGSGVIIDAGGLIVTNNHVVEGSTAVRVTLFDGRIFDATVEGTDAITDLALVRIEATGLTPIAIGNTSELSIGSKAIAIGSPLALVGGPSLSVGVISAFDREVNTSSNQLFGMLQTDAAINPGSSGGALVNDRGELIGIVTAVAVSDRGPEGIGFATPVEVMTRIIDELRATGTVRHAFLGIIGSTYVADLEDGSMRPSGAEIVDFAPDSAAETAGLQIGDTIIAVDGVEYRTMDSLIIALRFYSVGDTIQVDVIRNGEEVTVPVILGERPDDL